MEVILCGTLRLSTSMVADRLVENTYHDTRFIHSTGDEIEDEMR